MKILWCSVIRYLFTNEAELINQTGRQLSHSRLIFFSPRFTFLSLLLHLLSTSYFFLLLLQITNDVFLLTSKCGCRSRMYEESSAKCWHFTETEKNCCLVDAAFSTGCDEKSFVSIFGESAAEPPQPLPAAAAPPYIEAASSSRKDGSPPHALHTTIQEPCADDTRWVDLPKMGP